MQKAPRTPTSVVPTCADMGPLLRGRMDDDQEAARTEALIVAACEHGPWPLAMLECVARATEPRVHECVDKLPEDMLAAYGSVVTLAAGDDPDASAAAASCEEIFAASAVDAWPPAVSTEVERSLATRLRKPLLLAECEHWPAELKQCLWVTPTSGIDQCFAAQDAARADLSQAIREADELRARIVEAQAHPASVTCAKAVAAHYAPAKWSGKAPELVGAKRTKAIAASKKAMTEACKAWPVEARACIVIDDGPACYALAAASRERWSYPADTGSGLPECDEYTVAVEQFSACTSIPQATRDAVRDSYRQATAAWKVMKPEEREVVKEACTAAADALREAAAGCT